MELFKEILSFLKNPRRDIRSEKPASENLKDIFLIFICTFITVIGLVAPIMFSVLDMENIPNKLQDLSENISQLQFFLLGVVVAPLAEEFIFRFPLKYRKGVLILILAFLSALLFYLASKMFSENHAIILGLSLFLPYTILLLINESPLSELGLKKLFPFVFYITAALFGFAHVSNYALDPSLWYMTPILVMPQLLLGLMLGFVRLKYGLWASILMHAMNNFIPFMAMVFAPEI